MQFSLEQPLHVMRGPFCLWLLSGHKFFETALLYLIDVRPSLHEYEVYGLLIASGTFVAMGSAVAQWQSVGFQRQRSWVRSSPAALCCVLEQGTFTSHSTG